MLRSVLVATGVLAVLAVPAGAQEPWPKLESSTVSPSTIEAGRSAVQTITIDRPAPKGGILLSSSGSSLYNSWRCCTQLKIPEGERSISFPIREATTSATTFTYTHGVQVSGNGLKAGQAPLTVIPPDPAVQRIVAIHGPRAMLDGTSADVSVELLAPAPADDLVLSWWPNTAYGATVSGSVYVTIPAGRRIGSESRYANLWGSDVPAVVTPSASLGASTVYWTTVLVPRRFAVGSTYVEPGKPALVGVGIGEAPNPSGTTVALSTDVPGLTLPASVTIPAGDPGAPFEIEATSTPRDGTTGTITATWNGQSVTGQVYVGPSPDPTPTPSPTATATPTPTATETPTPTATASPTPTPTPSPTPTATATPTPTPTPSPTPTATPSPSPTPTPTPSPSPTPTPTPTPTPAPVFAPPAPVLTAPANYSWTRTATFTVAGTAQVGSTVEIFDGGTSFGTTTATGAGTWSRAITVPSDGAYLLTARARNLGGTSPSSALRVVQVDTRAPAPPTITAPSGSAGTSFTLTGTAEPSTTLELFEDGVSRGTIATSGNGTWSRAMTGVTPGVRTYTARTTDFAGNTSALSAAQSLTVR